MPRCVDADKIADFVCSICGDICCDEFKNRGCVERQFIEECAKKMPTADAVEVVRCKDCRLSTVTELRELYCYRLEDIVGAEDYCSKGERKEDETVHG